MESVLHPVHIITYDKRMSQSALIPFCEFGGKMSGMGAKIDQFELPVCSSFQAKILNDQLCYEVDLNKFSNKHNIERQLESGFAFIMDYNEDRQVTYEEDYKTSEYDSLVHEIGKSDEDQHAFIYLDTIGKWCHENTSNISLTSNISRASKIDRRRRVQYEHYERNQGN